MEQLESTATHHKHRVYFSSSAHQQRNLLTLQVESLKHQIEASTTEKDKLIGMLTKCQHELEEAVSLS